MSKKVKFLLILFSSVGLGLIPGIALTWTDNYKGRLDSTKEKIIRSADVAIAVCNGHIQFWSILVSVPDASAEGLIAKSMDLQSGMIADLKRTKSKVESEIGNLRKPPADFADCYTKLVSVYGTYSNLIEAAVSPSGSLLTYSQSIKVVRNDFIKGMSELSVMIPR